MKEEDFTAKDDNYFIFLKEKLDKIEASKTEEEKALDDDPTFTNQAH